MELANFTTKMEACMMVNGIKIKWKDMANCTISQGS